MKVDFHILRNETYISLKPETVEEMRDLVFVAKNHKNEKPFLFYFGLGTIQLELGLRIKTRSSGIISNED